SDAVFLGRSPGRAERVNVSFFAPFGGAQASLDGRDTPLAPLERRQFDDVGAGALRVHVAAGRVQAYATVVSNSGTNDPLASPPPPLASPSTDWTVPAVAAATGRNGARFSSDLFVSAPGSAADVTLTFLAHDGSAPAAARLALDAGETRL